MYTIIISKSSLCYLTRGIYCPYTVAVSGQKSFHSAQKPVSPRPTTVENDSYYDFNNKYINSTHILELLANRTDTTQPHDLS